MKAELKTVTGALRPSWAAIQSTGVPFLRRTLRLLGVAERDLEDVLQDVLVATVGALERFDANRYTGAAALAAEGDDDGAQAAAGAALARLRPRASLLCNWLFGIAWRQVSHYRDRAFRRREIPAGLCLSPTRRERRARLVDEKPGPEQQLAAAERAALIGAALTRVDEPRRAVLVLHDMLEVGVPEIAQELGVNPNTMQNRLRLARADFQRALRRMGEEKRRALQVDEQGPLPGVPASRRPRSRSPRGRRSAGAISAGARRRR